MPAHLNHRRRCPPFATETSKHNILSVRRYNAIPSILVTPLAIHRPAHPSSMVASGSCSSASSAYQEVVAAAAGECDSTAADGWRKSRLAVVNGTSAMNGEGANSLFVSDGARSNDHDGGDATTSTITDSELRRTSISNMEAVSSRPRRQTRMMQITLAPLLLLLSLQLMPTAVHSATDADGNPIDQPDRDCVCSPREFFFRLNLSANCPNLPPPFPPNDVFGGGVKDYTCTIGPEPLPNPGEDGTELLGTAGLDDGATEGVNNDGMDVVTRDRMRSLLPNVPSQTRTAKDFFPEIDLDAPLQGLEWSSQQFTTSQLNEAGMSPGQDTVPVSIYSIQFLEVDTEFNIINQDSKYVRGIDFADGERFSYDSISKTNAGVVPGGINMVLRGVNADGEPVRNVFTITYTNDCDVQTFSRGEDIGWVEFVSARDGFGIDVQSCALFFHFSPECGRSNESNLLLSVHGKIQQQANFEPALSDTCDAEAPDTIAPIQSPTPKPISPPTPSTPKPTRAPNGMSMQYRDPSDMSMQHAFFSKSSKSKSSKSKSGKNAKSSKSAKSYSKSQSVDGGGWYSSSTKGAASPRVQGPPAVIPNHQSKAMRRRKDRNNGPIRRLDSSRGVRGANPSSTRDLFDAIDLDDESFGDQLHLRR